MRAWGKAFLGAAGLDRRYRAADHDRGSGLGAALRDRGKDGINPRIAAGTLFGARSVPGTAAAVRPARRMQRKTGAVVGQQGARTTYGDFRSEHRRVAPRAVSASIAR